MILGLGQVAFISVTNDKSSAQCVHHSSCCPNWQMHSSDGGKSWSPRTSVVPAPAVAWPARAGPGTGIQLSASHKTHPNRMLNIGWHSSSNGSRSASFDSIFFSDDGGATWQQPAQKTQLNTPCDEAQLAELPDGAILAMMRPTVTRFKACPKCRQLSKSTDGGATWGWDGKIGHVKAEPQLNGAICMGSLLSDLDNNKVYASFPNATSGARVGGAIRVSKDSGASWSDLAGFGGDKVPFA